MPKTSLHNVQKRKNITLFVVLLLLMVIIYAITLVRLTSQA
jgi:hypothetical protein